MNTASSDTSNTERIAPSLETAKASPRLSFKEMCSKFDVTPRTLRYYEYIELLSPERDGRARWYGSKELARMTLIRRGRRFGFALEVIRQWLDMYEGKGQRAQMEAWVIAATEQLEALEAQRRDLDATIDDLQRLRDETVTSLK